MGYETILYEEDGPVGTLTLNRPDDGNMFTETMCHEVRDCINAVRRETRTRVMVLTGAGDRFFCIGGRKAGMEETTLYAGVLPTLDMYESIERLQKPVIASVNGYAVGGGNVLQVMCDITIAKESAIFRQVGPMMAASTPASAPGISKTWSARRRPRRSGSATRASPPARRSSWA
jgi:naphthoate synthase